MRWTVLPLLLLSSCLLLAKRPCIDVECPDGFSCGSDGTCLTACSFSTDCRDGFVCSDLATCDAACVDADCPGSFACDPDANACYTHCYSDDYCRDGTICCHEGDTGCTPGECY